MDMPIRYLALATDYDGTIAHDGVVDDATIRALEQLVRSGRKLILVTGRELPDLESIFPRLDLCTRVVAENGALLYNPATKEQKVLSKAPPPEFIQALERRGITDFRVGSSIVATWRPNETHVLEAIQELGLELQIAFNKEAVMVLPSGVNKSTGLAVALEELGLSAHNLVGIGDAENDHAFLESCECSAAVANAISSLKEKACFVTKGARGQGVIELIAHLIDNDLAGLDLECRGNRIHLGTLDEQLVTLPVYGHTILVCGQSGSGKSTLIMGLVERISNQKYQVCLVDPEGDYENLATFRTIGTSKHAPTPAEIGQALADPSANVVVNLMGVTAGERPDRFSSLISELQDNRLQTGRPHWIIVDEAHHVFPSEWALTAGELPNELKNVVLITVHPDHVSPQALRNVKTVVVVGSQPKVVIDEFARTMSIDPPEIPADDLERGHALVWFIDEAKVLTPVRIEPSKIEHERHKRKYAEGKIEEERIFHFRGPEQKMDLKAYNLTIFVQLAEGVDEETWMFHLRNGDYSDWVRTSLKDPELGNAIAGVEQNQSLSAQDSRTQIIDLIAKKYTAPAN